MNRTNRISYDYLFNYFGKGTYEGKPVTGASIALNIRPYKDGKEVLFKDGDEPKLQDCYLCDIYKVSFNRKTEFVVKENVDVKLMYLLAFEWDRIEYEITDYSLDVHIGTLKDRFGDDTENLPDGFLDTPISKPVTVTEEEFREFLSVNEDDFDIPDNRSAQIPSVRFYDISAEGDNNEQETNDPANPQ